jgi:hypothetical protein
MRYKFIRCAAMISCVCMNLATAQVNTEKFRSAGDSLSFNGYALFDLYLRSGNVSLAEIGLSGRVSHRSASSVTFLIVEGEYGWQNKNQYSNEGLLHLRYVYFWLPDLMPEVYMQYDYNKARLLLSRIVGGAGLRFNLFRTHNNAAWFGTSVFKEYDLFDLPPDAAHPQKMDIFRWSNYLSVSYNINETLELSCVLYYQPKLDVLRDYHILNENFLRILFSKWISLTIGTNLRFDSDPPDEINTLDARTKIGFGFRF